MVHCFIASYNCHVNMSLFSYPANQLPDDVSRRGTAGTRSSHGSVQRRVLPRTQQELSKSYRHLSSCGPGSSIFQFGRRFH